MNIKEGPFETLDIVEVAMNNGEVAMNNDNNEFRKMIKIKLANKKNILLPNININMQLLNIMSMKTMDDLKIDHINKKSFTENKIGLEKYQEAFIYTKN